MSWERALRLLITGRVQGVGFRLFVQGEAERLGVAGWVRNRRDGSVEAVLEGPAEAVAALVEACGRGPAMARVDAVDAGPATDPDLPAVGRGFRLLPTS